MGKQKEKKVKTSRGNQLLKLTLPNFSTPKDA